MQIINIEDMLRDEIVKQFAKDNSFGRNVVKYTILKPAYEGNIDECTDIEQMIDSYFDNLWKRPREDDDIWEAAMHYTEAIILFSDQYYSDILGYDYRKNFENYNGLGTAIEQNDVEKVKECLDKYDEMNEQYIKNPCYESSFCMFLSGIYVMATAPEIKNERIKELFKRFVEKYLNGHLKIEND